MTQTPVASTPARDLFPELPRIPSLYRAEAEGLSEEHLDRRRPEKSWGLWSIREQVSHMTSLPYRWLLVRWGPTLFGDRLPRNPELLRTGFSVRMMNPARFHAIGDLLAAQADAFALAWEVLGRETLGSLRAREISERIPWGTRHPPAYEEEREWREKVVLRAHPTGVRVDPADPDLFHYDLEFTFRHILWEAYVHLRTIQMHKQAEGLAPRGEIPREGYVRFHHWE